MQNFKELTREERRNLLSEMGEKPFREKQIFEWICKGTKGFDEMTNLSLSLREKIKAQCSFETLKIITVQTSNDGTKKYLLEAPDGERVEAVFMKYEYGNSICVSTQVGCNMGCVFCASGIGGKRRNLKAWEMLDEFCVIQQDAGERINHIVLMGMGEPFDNYDEVKQFLALLHDKDGINLSLRNITVSSCGIIPGIEKYGKDFPQANLAISLHRANQQDREKLMPVARKYKLDDLIRACKSYAEKTSNRVSFEYALISGENDKDEDAAALVRLLKGMPAHVNLIPLNPVVENNMTGSSREKAAEFAAKLESAGLPATVRRRLGADIDAACGQLRKNYTCENSRSKI